MANPFGFRSRVRCLAPRAAAAYDDFARRHMTSPPIEQLGDDDVSAVLCCVQGRYRALGVEEGGLVETSPRTAT